MLTRNTAIIVLAFGVLSAVFVLFLIGVNRATDPNPNREADLKRLAMQRPDDIVPTYENDTAIVTLRQGEKSGPLIVTETRQDRVKIELMQYGSERIVPAVLRIGDEAPFAWGYKEIVLLDATRDSATFKFVKGSLCPGYG